MKNIGIVCEYNPFHNGHAKQLAAFDRTVCLMSGNYVQRGEPAIFDKYLRARAAVDCGASLVLELPITVAVRSAEGFADGAVEIFSRLGCVNAICFGSEEGDIKNIMSTAKTLLHPDFPPLLRAELVTGVSFPRARQRALEKMGADASVLEKPNDILAVEYCKALLRRESDIKPIAVRREGDYHTGTDAQNPSASVLRERADWTGYVPEAAMELFRTAQRHDLKTGERAVLARLKAIGEAEFEQLPYGSEGLWRRLMHACREGRDMEEIVALTKSKRYTRSRIMRMILCAYLGIDEALLHAEVPYVRILAMNENGREILKASKKNRQISLLHGTETPPNCDFAELERRAEALYPLFAADFRAKTVPPASIFSFSEKKA